ncbi:MAG: L-2-amino-thiazoline-4-carboxylic acid hydrolase [Rhodothermaceae bacterium]|nr:L-2-amino-thiazoline-4-carboxylic acid hydrolase [Rhodothermaceae bacterium]
MMQKQDVPPDTLTQKIGVLTRREVEARILAPIIDALGEEFGRDEVISIVKNVIIHLASQQGSELAETMGGTDADAFMNSLAYWTRDDALQLDVIENNETSLHFNVTRCRYAELYKALGIPELGAVFSCNRDFALIEGFNPDATLKRTQTIMQGASHCDFRYTFPDDHQESKDQP